jgi:hypothetical protein
MVPTIFTKWCSYLGECVFFRRGLVSLNSQNSRFLSSEVAISNISQETLKKVVRNMVTRENTCYAKNGCHFQLLLQNLVSCFLNMFLYVINCFNETTPTDCPFTPWAA